MVDPDRKSEEREKLLQTTDTVFDTDIISLAILGAKLFGALLLIYLLGYYQFSFSWIFLGTVLWVWKLQQSQKRDIRNSVVRACALNEKATIMATVQDVPSWVYFPDTERAEWVNKMLHQLWPYVNFYAQDLIRTVIEPQIQDVITNYGLPNFRFEKMVLGDIPPRIGGIKLYKEHVSRNEMVMDVEIFYAGDCHFTVSVKRMLVGVKDFQLHGTARLIFKPLINQMPLVGGVQVFFLNNPTIDFNLTNLAGMFDIPGLNDILKKIVVDQVAAFMVLPNKLPIQLSADIPASVLKCPQPAGVLRINVLEARELEKKDVGMLGMGKSDPYVIVNVGAQEFRTQIINNTITPVWDFWCDMTVEMQGQFIVLEVNDHDPGTRGDDFLGRASVDIYNVKKKGHSDMWVPLEEVKSGSVHLLLTWMDLSNDPLDLSKHMNQMQRLKDRGLSTCSLVVFIDSAKELPNVGKVPMEPSPLVRLTVGSQKKQTYHRESTNDPVFEEGFSFLIQNPEVQELNIDVIDSKSDKSIGYLTVLTNDLLHQDRLEMEQPFRLRGSGPNSKLIMMLHLRILVSGGEGQDVPSGNSLSTGSDAFVKSKSFDTSELSQPTAATAPVIRMMSVDSVPTTPTEEEQPQEMDGLRRRPPPSSDTDSTAAKIQLTLRYSGQRQKLVFIVHRIVNLIPIEEGEEPDPYVKIYLLPEKSRDSKRKTTIIKNARNPVYDETFEYTLSPNELTNHTLSLTVNSTKETLFSKTYVMGQLKLDLSEMDLSKAITEWFNLEPGYTMDK